MTLHHTKHHQAYVSNLNAALKSQNSNDASPNSALLATLCFNGGGHINHSLFWENLVPSSSNTNDFETAAPPLSKLIVSQFGGLEAFKKEFAKLLLGIKGSGWGWLVLENGTKEKLRIVQTKDQDIVAERLRPLFGVDMWEHAYYLQYLNEKVKYVESIWNIINWEKAEDRLVNTKQWELFSPIRSFFVEASSNL